MQFRNRIKHIEQKISLTASDFCACENNPRYPRTETVYWENGKPATNPELVNRMLPDACPTCSKSIHKTQIIIDFIDSKIPKPEGAK